MQTEKERETEEGNASNPIASAFNESFLFDSVVGRDPAEQSDPINPCFEITPVSENTQGTFVFDCPIKIS